MSHDTDEGEKGQRRGYPERIAEAEQRLEIATAELERLRLEYLAERAKSTGAQHLRHHARVLRAMLRAGMREKSRDVGRELEELLESWERPATGPEGEP